MLQLIRASMSWTSLIALVTETVMLIYDWNRYKGRGLFISPVKAALVRGKWQVASHANPSDGLPSWGEAPRISRAFDSLEDLFDRRRWSDDKDLVSQYETIVDQELDR